MCAYSEEVGGGWWLPGQDLKDINFRLELNSKCCLGSESPTTCFLSERREAGAALGGTAFQASRRPDG